MAREKIMVVDDSPTEMRLVLNALANKGFDIVTASDGEEAIDKAGREKPRLMILDVVMPKKNGFQVCRHVKTAADTRDIRVLMLTSKGQDSDRFWATKQGADAYLTKPFAEDELLAAIGKLL
jgi:twitching motility two-component system response regulator PilH